MESVFRHFCFKSLKNRNIYRYNKNRRNYFFWIQIIGKGGRLPQVEKKNGSDVQTRGYNDITTVEFHRKYLYSNNDNYGAF